MSRPKAFHCCMSCLCCARRTIFLLACGNSGYSYSYPWGTNMQGTLHSRREPRHGVSVQGVSHEAAMLPLAEHHRVGGQHARATQTEEFNMERVCLNLLYFLLRWHCHLIHLTLFGIIGKLHSDSSTARANTSGRPCDCIAVDRTDDVDKVSIICVLT